jgi:hypothetical protein
VVCLNSWVGIVGVTTDDKRAVTNPGPEHTIRPITPIGTSRIGLDGY